MAIRFRRSVRFGFRGRGASMASLGAMSLAVVFLAPAARAADDRPVVIARDMDFGSLDPARGYCDTCQMYFNATYDTLVTLAPGKTDYVPELATSWEANADLTRFTFHLNPKATFSDGTPVTSKDVKWTFERLHNLKASPSLLMDGLKTVETPDPLTAVVVWDAPNSETIGDVSSVFAGIINSAAASKVGATSDADAATKDTADPGFQAASMGSGPFVLDSFKPNDQIVMKKNPTYWGKPAGVSSVIIKQVKDAVSQLQSLQTGGADIATQIDPDTAASIHDDKLTVEQQPSFNFVFLALQPGAPGADGKLTPPVREAIRDAIDYQGLLDFIIGGKGRLLASPVPIGFPGTTGLPIPKQDVEKSKALLAKAGIDSLTLDASFPAMNIFGADIATMMQKIQQDLAKVNVKLNLDPLTFSVWVDKTQSGKTPVWAGYFAPDYVGTGDYLKYFGLLPGTFVSVGSGLEKMPEGTNKKEADLFKQALAANGDKAESLFKQTAEAMIDDRIVFPLMSPDVLIVRNEDVQGVVYSPLCNLLLPELHR